MVFELHLKLNLLVVFLVRAVLVLFFFVRAVFVLFFLVPAVLELFLFVLRLVLFLLLLALKSLLERLGRDLQVVGVPNVGNLLLDVVLVGVPDVLGQLLLGAALEGVPTVLGHLLLYDVFVAFDGGIALLHTV
jgi:hypothetical protein